MRDVGVCPTSGGFPNAQTALRRVAPLGSTLRGMTKRCSFWVVLPLLVMGCEGQVGTLDSEETSSSDASTHGDGAPADAASEEGPDSMVDASTDATSSADADPSERRVGVFIAQGDIGRTTISCDDGRSWVADRSWDAEGHPRLCGSTEAVYCFRDGAGCSYLNRDGECATSADCDCGHHPGFAKGIAFGDGYFVATWGWGYPGQIMRSRDGVSWEPALDGHSFGGIAYGAGHFVAASRSPMVSSDAGESWVDGGEADFRNDDGSIMWSVRSFGFADYEEGRFVAVAEAPDRDILVSSDGGASWWRPSVIPADCARGTNSYGSILYGNGVILITDLSGNACRSTDGGETWSVSSVAEEGQLTAHAVFTGEEFVVFMNGSMFRSADGASWSETEMTTPRRLGPVAYSPDTGTFVAVGSVWDGYEDQRFLRSGDGLSWEVLSDSAGPGGHPIFHIGFGEAEPSADCP